MASASFRTKTKTLFVDALGQALTDLGQAGVVGRSLVLQEAEEGLHRAAIGTTPGDGPLRVEALEVADEEHAEVDAGRHTRSAEAVGVVGAAQILNERLEARLVQQRIEARVKRIRRRRGQILEGDDQIRWRRKTSAQHGFSPPVSGERCRNLTQLLYSGKNRLFQRAAIGRPACATICTNNCASVTLPLGLVPGLVVAGFVGMAGVPPVSGGGASLSDTLDFPLDLLELGLQLLFAAREFLQLCLSSLVFLAQLRQFGLLLTDALSEVLKGDGTAGHNAAELQENIAIKEPRCL